MFIHNFVWVGGCLGQLRLGRPVDSLLALPFGTAWQSGRQRLTDELGATVRFVSFWRAPKSEAAI